MIGVAEPSFARPSTSTSGPPIMKSVCTLETLTPRSSSASARDAVGSVDRHRQAAAVRDVAGGVLVEERVVEDEPCLPDTRGAVHERDLAEERRLVVLPQLRPDHVGAVAVRLDVHDPASPRSGPASPRPARRSRGRSTGTSTHDSLGATPVGRREDLLRRQVRQVLDPATGLEGRAEPSRGLEQADDQIGARARGSGSHRSAARRGSRRAP